MVLRWHLSDIESKELKKRQEQIIEKQQKTIAVREKSVSGSGAQLTERKPTDSTDKGDKEPELSSKLTSVESVESPDQ